MRGTILRTQLAFCQCVYNFELCAAVLAELYRIGVIRAREGILHRRCRESGTLENLNKVGSRNNNFSG